MQRYLGEECSSRGTSEGLGQKCAWSVPGPVRRPQSSIVVDQVMYVWGAHQRRPAWQTIIRTSAFTLSEMRSH